MDKLFGNVILSRTLILFYRIYIYIYRGVRVRCAVVRQRSQSSDAFDQTDRDRSDFWKAHPTADITCGGTLLTSFERWVIYIYIYIYVA